MVNQADFITGGIERHLERCLGWETQKVLSLGVDGIQEEQKFDAYKVFRTNRGVKLCEIEAGNLIVKKYVEKLGFLGLSDFAGKLENYYFARSCFGISHPYEDYRECFNHEQTSFLRVAIEIETGNIASSFRSLYKLSALFAASLIDLGVLITSSRKHEGATSIWPSSNRNGSIEELNHRRAFDNLNFPLLRVGFLPDGCSSDAPYLASNGTTYSIPTESTEVLNGVAYRVGETPVHGTIYTKV